MANCPGIPEKFTFHWKVTNFDACFLHNHEAFDSPSFSLRNFCNTRWYLRLSLESHRKYGFEYVCALVREYDEGPALLGVRCKVSCESETIAEGFQSFTKGSKYDIKVPELYDFDKFPQMNSLVFKCEMYFNFGEEMLGDNSNFPSCCLRPRLPTASRESLSENSMNADKRIYTYPRQGFGFSRYLVERRIFLLPFMLEKTPKIVTSFTETPSFSVEFNVVSEDDFDYLKINFHLVEARLKSNLLLYSEVSFVDSNSETIDSGKDYHLFRRNHAEEVWSFGHFFDWSQIELKERESSNLQFSCNLYFFDGQLQSEILWTADVADFQQAQTEWVSASEILDRKTCKEEMSVETVDVKIDQTKPLFETLSPSLEKDVGYSDYLESETVHQKARTEHLECCLEQTEFENTVPMHSKAEKLQTIFLKTNRKCLDETMDFGNFCTVLITANTHQDKKLYDAAVEFFAIHKNRLLKSNTWEKFAKENCELTMKILTEVCVKLPEKIIEF